MAPGKKTARGGNVESRMISIRFPTTVLGDVKALAQRRNEPYQSLIKDSVREYVLREASSSSLKAGEQLAAYGREKPALRGRPKVRAMSVEAWADLDEDVEGELVDGVLEEEEVATFLHELVVGWLLDLLRPWARARGGFAVGSEAKLAVGSARGRKPDVTVFLGSAKPRLEDRISRVAPYLVVEVLSPRPRDVRRDRIEKLGDYAALGARYYWLLDPQVRTLEILTLGRRRRYELTVNMSAGSLRRVPGCGGLVIDLDTLWKEMADAAGRRPRVHRVKRGR